MNGQKSIGWNFCRKNSSEGQFPKSWMKQLIESPLIYSPAEGQLLRQFEARPLRGGWLESLDQSPVATLDCMHMLDLRNVDLLEKQEQYSR